MFNRFNYDEHCDYKSNSKVLKVPVTVPLEKDGKVINHSEVKVQTNESLLAGLSFVEEIHGLRAKLNLGIKPSEVPNVNLDDFDSAYRKLKTFSGQFDAYVLERTKVVEESETSTEK